MTNGIEVIDGKLLLTIKQASEYLNLGRTIVYRLVMTGEIRSVKIGRCRRIPVYALQEFVMSREPASRS